MDCALLQNLYPAAPGWVTVGVEVALMAASIGREVRAWAVVMACRSRLRGVVC